MVIHGVSKLLLAVTQLTGINKRDGFCIQGLASKGSASKGSGVRGVSVQVVVIQPLRFGIPAVQSLAFPFSDVVSDVQGLAFLACFSGLASEGMTFLASEVIMGVRGFAFLASKV